MHGFIYNLKDGLLLGLGVHIKSKECLKLFRKDVTTKKFLPKALKLFYTEEETENETSRVERNEALYYHWYDAGKSKTTQSFKNKKLNKINKIIFFFH